ncbi:MAG TPA: glucose 1-dehydrogenase [Leifsonia sp.]|jgi:glucose 1-dehydrogenase|nr:glucose 1-dehydrogenase [Leifsonia sp.]
MRLKDKTVVVTGGNTGIGAAIAKAAAREGADVVVDYVAHPDDTADLVQDIVSSGGRAIGVEADVSKTEDIDRLIRAAVDEFGHLDVFVNNAGIEKRKSLLETDEAGYDEVLAVNVRSAFFGTKLAAQQFIRQGDGGVVVNMSSVHEDWPMPGNTAYCVSKGAMRMLTRTAGVELGPQGVRVVGIAPGAVNTPINEKTMADADTRKKLEQSIPLRKVADPSAVADAVVFVASDEGRYLTASTVFVDGGIMQGSVGL